jgi:hypothetical protein
MRVLAAMATCALLVACTAADHPVPGGQAFEADDLRFVAPTGWEVRPPSGFQSQLNRTVVFLANQPLESECRTQGPGMVECDSPLAGGLRAGGTLIWWVARACAAQFCDLPPGSLMQVGNRLGVHGPIDYGCDGAGYTERSAYYVTVTPQRVDVLLVCARNPTDATREALLGFLDTIQWRVP